MSRRRAFTLVELLVVIAIITVLIGLLLPAIQRVRESAARTQCFNNLKQIGLALHNYHDVYKVLPPGYTATGPYTDGGTDTAPGWGWAAHILPFAEQDALYRTLNVPAGGNVELAPGIATVVKLYVCPSDPIPPAAIPITTLTVGPQPFGPSSYVATCGDDNVEVTDKTGTGVFFRNSRVALGDITDGTSQTVMAGDRSVATSTGVWAGAPAGGLARPGPKNNVPGAPPVGAACLVLAHNNWVNKFDEPDGALDDFSSFHPGGVNLVYADGAVRFYANVNADDQRRKDFWAQGTRAGGEVVSAAGE